MTKLKGESFFFPGRGKEGVANKGGGEKEAEMLLPY